MGHLLEQANLAKVHFLVVRGLLEDLLLRLRHPRMDIQAVALLRAAGVLPQDTAKVAVAAKATATSSH
jgi:hypothetical protein